jgi:hypothetical protein
MSAFGRFWVSLVAGALVIGGLATPSAFAQQQSVTFYLGGFVPRGLDSRGRNDVLFANGDFLANRNDLSFDLGDFTGPTFGADWLIAVNDWVDAGVGLGFYQRTSHTFYRDYVNPDGSDITQDLKLRIVPFTATFRVLPLGHHGIVRPYAGAGVGVMAWRYSETGSFLDFNNVPFRDSFSGSGTDVGPVLLGGVTVPIGSSDLGFEVRHQSGKGKLPTDQGFSAPNIDLGGTSYLAVFNIRF